MIFFKPYPVNTAECTARFEALQGSDCRGECALRMDGVRAEVYQLAFLDDAEIGEGLLRAAYSYAANRGAYIGVCTAEHAEAATARLRFETKDGCLQNDIPTLLTGCCAQPAAD